MQAGILGSTAGVFAGARPARALGARRRHAVRRAATCQAAAEKLTVAITGSYGDPASRLSSRFLSMSTSNNSGCSEEAHSGCLWPLLLHTVALLSVCLLV